MQTKTTQFNSFYKNLSLSKINSYGDHKGTGITGRISSLFHWSIDYDQRNLAEYYIQWANDNSKNKIKIVQAVNQNIFNAVNTIQGLKDINTLNAREIAHFVVAFKHATSKNSLSHIVSSYITLKQNTKHASNVDIDVFIKLTQNLVKTKWTQKDQQAIVTALTDSINNPNMLQLAQASIKNAMQEGYIFEPACSLYGYFYCLFPIIEATLSTLTGSLLFTHFWAMFIAGTLAALSITIFSGLIYGACNYKENGIFAGALQGLQEEWNQKNCE